MNLFFNQTIDAIWLVDPTTTRVVDCNQAAVTLMRCQDKESLLGKRPEDLSPAVQQDGLSTTASVAQRIAETLREGNSRFEWRIHCLDGTAEELALDVVMTRLEFDNRTLLCAITREISERKRAETEIRQLNTCLEKRVAERTILLVQANDQLKSEIAERQRQEKIQRAIYQISEALHMADDLPNFYGRIHAIVRTLMPARNFYLALLDLPTQTISFPYFVDEQADDWPAPRLIGTGLTGVVLRTGKTLLADRAMSARAQRVGDEIILEGVEVPYIEAGKEAAVWLGAPLMSQGKAFGVMAVQDYVDESAYGEGEKQILTFVAEQTALAITRKRSEQALRDSEEQHRALFEATRQGVMLHDEKAFFSVNPAALRILGYEHAEDLLGKHPAEISVPRQPDGEDSRVAAQRQIGFCLREGSARFDWMTKRADGTEVMLDVLLTAIELGGRKIIQAVVDDITIRKQEEQALRESEARLRESEARFSTAFRASPVLITISRMTDGKFVEVNDAFVRWFGLGREQVLGRDGRELSLWAQLEDRTRFLSDLQRTRSLRGIECQLRSSSGSVHTVLLSADLIEINRVPHMLVAGLDVTQRKHAEAELLKTIAREKELGQLRSNFVSMVSHEFRTPLGIIQSSAEILQDYFEQLEPEERVQHLQSVHKNTRRMAEMMEEVLFIGRLDSGKMDCKPTPLDLRALARQLVDEVNSATEQRCAIELAIGDLPQPAHADERLLQHIVTNLLTNAVKYSEPGRTVRLEIHRDGPDAVCVIRDQGIGISEADREWLFKAFHRGTNVGDRVGTGLGLVIVKRCVELHGGKIKLESKLGEGTNATVRLPVFPQPLLATGQAT